MMATIHADFVAWAGMICADARSRANDRERFANWEVVGSFPPNPDSGHGLGWSCCAPKAALRTCSLKDQLEVASAVGDGVIASSRTPRVPSCVDRTVVARLVRYTSYRYGSRS